MHPDTVLLERYELRDPLGRGGMGTVYRAYDRQLGRFVAVKVFAAGEAGDDARRRAEATALARLSHPNLVALHDAHLSAEGDPTPSFLVMELVDGEDLRSRLDRGPLPGAEAAAVAGGIAEALVVVHAAGMVHRDLKPANILLAEQGVPGAMPHAKLADFGIAHLIGSERLTTVGTVIGTAGYLSPEQAGGGEPGPAADVYALGLVVLEALTGRREYPGTPLEAVSARAARDPRIPASLPDDWRGLLGAMTARDAGLRPTALETAVMARELAPQVAGWSPTDDDEPTGQGLTGPTVAMPAAGIVGGAPVAAAPSETSTLPVTARRPTRRRVTGAVLLAAAAAAVVALVLALGSLLAPATTTPGTETTHRPTPTVTTPPQTVQPAVDSPAPQPAQPPAQQDNPKKGPGNDKGNEKGKGKGKGGD